MCVGLCPIHLTTFDNAEKNRNGGCPQHKWDHPPFFETPIPRPQGPMDRRGKRGTSANIVPTQIKFGVDPSTRCWDIVQKPPKCKNSPLTPIVTKISFSPFFRPQRPLTPKRREDTSRTRVRLHAKFGVNWAAGCREIIDLTKKNKKEKTNKHTVKQIPRPWL